MSNFLGSFHPCRLSLHSLPSLIVYPIVIIIKKAAVRRSMRRCLIAQSRSMSKTPRPPSCAYPSSGLIAVRPPYKNTLRSQKSVPLHFTLKKCYAARSIMYIRPMVISFLKAWRSQLTFGFEKGRQAGSLSRPRKRLPTETNAHRLPNAKWHILKEDKATPDKLNVVPMT